MNKIINKQSFTMQESFILHMPVYSEIVKIAYQIGIITVWYLHDADDALGVLVARNFRVVGTGNAFDVESGCQHLETLLDYTAGTIWHIFEVTP